MNENEKTYRGKPRVQVWVYGNDGLCRKFDSITEAALTMGENIVTLNQASKQGRITRKGYLYSTKQLTVNEVDKKFKELEEKQAKMKKNQPKQRANTNCKEFEDKFEYDVNCFDREVCYIPSSRQGKLNLLRNFIYSKLELQWMNKPRQLVALEKRFIRELLHSLE